MSAQESPPRPSVAPTRLVLAGAAGMTVFLVVNGVACFYLTGAATDTNPSVAAAYQSYYDGCVALLPLAVPSFLGGLVMSKIAGPSAHKLSMAVFAIAAIVGFVHPYWRLPLVSPHSEHSAVMRYMITNPLVMLAFGTLGGWLGTEFAVGRFTLDDSEPVMPAGD